MEVTEYMVSAMVSFYAYLVSVCRFGILGCVDLEPFRIIQRTEEFEINVGQYMAYTEAIYKEKKWKDMKYLLNWLQEREELEYAYESFTGLDFTGEDFRKIDFRYSDLRNTILKNVSFQDSLLIGTRFCHADMEGANLNRSLIHEADFTGANLKGANLSLVEGDAGTRNAEVWEGVGYVGVSFRDANLCGADFTDARLSGADFTGAVMDEAVFSEGQVQGLNLTEEQRKGIIVR